MTIFSKTILFSFLLLFSSNTYAHSFRFSFGDVVVMVGIILIPIILVVIFIVMAIYNVRDIAEDSETEEQKNSSKNTSEQGVM